MSISPADLTASRSLQSFADRAAAAGKGARLCLSPGIYNLDTPLRLSSQHAYLTIEACGPGAILQASNNANPANFTDGLVVVAESASVTLRGLELFPAIAPLSPATLAIFGELLAENGIPQDEINAILASLRSIIGVRAIDAMDLSLEDCLIGLQTSQSDSPDIFAIGLFLQGDCSRLTVRDCSFHSGIGLTFHPPQQLRVLSDRIGSPPSSLEILALPADQLRLSLSRLATRVAATAQDQVVVTMGILASTAWVPGSAIPIARRPSARFTQVDCELGDSLIQGCQFSNLTMPVFTLFASFGALRMQDNHVQASLSGFWFYLPDATFPSERLAGDDFKQFWGTILTAEEVLLATIAVGYPPPAGVTIGSGGAQTPGPSSLFLVSNQIEALPRSGKAPDSSLALFVYGNRRPVENADPSFALLMSANQLRSFSGPSVPTAFIVVPNPARSAITGNLVMNDANREFNGADPSLWLVPNSTVGVALLSVTGNVLLGPSNIDHSKRFGLQPVQSWLLHNANPG